MSTVEDETTKPVATETEPSTETPEVAQPVPETAPEAVILAKDPEVVKTALETAEPVTTEAAEQPAADVTAATETAEATSAPVEASTEASPNTPEKPKEGAALFSFLKKHLPNPKSVDKNTSPKNVKSEPESAAPVTSEAVATKAEDDKPFEGGKVVFRTHGGLFRY
jgi:hypothetical protein